MLIAAMVMTMGTCVFANEVEVSRASLEDEVLVQMGEQLGADYEIVSSSSEVVDDIIIVKTLAVEKTKKSRSFSGTKNAVATHYVYANYGRDLSLEVTVRASFYGQSGENVVGIGNCSYSYYEPAGHWSFRYVNEDTKSNYQPSFGTKYSKYTLDYNAYNGINHNKSIWISCDVNGNISDNGGNV